MVLNKDYVVYIMASSTGTLDIGMTGFLFTRVGQHKAGERRILENLPLRPDRLLPKLRKTCQQILAESGRVRINIL